MFKDWDVVRHKITGRVGTIRGFQIGNMIFVAWDNSLGGMAYVSDLELVVE